MTDGLFHRGLVARVHGAQFGAHDERGLVRAGGQRIQGYLESVERREAAHVSDEGPAQGGGQAELRRQQQVR
ncbi:hypothetical protein BHS09_02390 [Myxococcus xanthus]|uniref:Uncharacterized protein n=1 Tax=Myxococcus xanthus TaxID=34 RepID=A0AAE6FVE4_MYXXA|nr:hypothetical protein BHS09_02390 [Myxococcus xanthus]QDE73215.1 hypothetical protein BHS08_02390 [Myxococcus xanthus]